jgi:hypothetical protein
MYKGAQKYKKMCETVTFSNLKKTKKNLSTALRYNLILVSVNTKGIGNLTEVFCMNTLRGISVMYQFLADGALNVTEGVRKVIYPSLRTRKPEAIRDSARRRSTSSLAKTDRQTASQWMQDVPIFIPIVPGLLYFLFLCD